VLARRFDGEQRTLVLAAPDGRTEDALPRGSLASLSIALAHVAELIDRAEDVLILYVATHGVPQGIVYYYGDEGYGGMSPSRLAALLAELGIANRLLVVNACYSGIFVPALASDSGVVISAAAADRTSFGCEASNDWTYFGDAFVNRALRRPQPLAEAFEQARTMIAGWENAGGMTPSEPRIAIGSLAEVWLARLEARMPRTATRPVGRPAKGEE
jgi:hypothetical protein